MGSKKKYVDESSSDASSSSSLYSSSFSSSSSDAETRSKHRRRRRDSKDKSSSKGSRKEKERSGKHHRSSSSSRKRKERSDRKDKKKRKLREDKHTSSRRKKRTIYDDDDEKPENPEMVVGRLFEEFPDVGNDLKQLLQMIDGGQAVDIRGISDRFLIKQLKKLFLSLDLEENDIGLFLLPPTVCHTMEVLGPVISSHIKFRQQQQLSKTTSPSGEPSLPVDMDCRRTTDQVDGTESSVKEDSPGPKKRRIGPEMPSSELLAAAAKLTEAEAVLREAEFEIDDGLFIGPAPAVVAAEAASANEAERFEEVTRIMAADVDSPYEVLGVNHKMSTDNMKKRYWKLSLMVHPDKCSHPQANQAFIMLNKAFKALQDPDMRKAMDDKIKLKEEQEAFKAELKAMREAAQWRRLQGISMEGDEELLAEIKMPPKREEWMTTLPPERKPGVSMQSTTAFSRTAKEGRGDTSVWTDAPADKAQKAKMSYLEAYNEAAALAANEEKKRTNPDADLVDQYNKTKRSKSLVEKHQEEKVGRSKRKSKEERKQQEWEGQHPWKPWDREKDLTAGRQKVNLDSESMVQGLTSRFAGGNIQRNFL